MLLLSKTVWAQALACQAGCKMAGKASTQVLEGSIAACLNVREMPHGPLFVNQVDPNEQPTSTPAMSKGGA
jgi:hypothetical protein